MKKKYWLRGGIIGFLIPVIIIVIVTVRSLIVTGYVPFTLGTPMWEQNILNIVRTLFHLHTLMYGSMLGTQTTELGAKILVAMWVIIFIAPILLGSLLGWLYPKVKNICMVPQ